MTFHFRALSLAKIYKNPFFWLELSHFLDTEDTESMIFIVS